MNCHVENVNTTRNDIFIISKKMAQKQVSNAMHYKIPNECVNLKKQKYTTLFLCYLHITFQNLHHIRMVSICSSLLALHL